MALKVDPVTKAVTIDRGDVLPLTIAVTDAAGNARDLTGYSVVLTIKKEVTDNIAAAVVQLSIGSGISNAGFASGLIVATVPQAVSESMNGDYIYDCEGRKAGAIETFRSAARWRVIPDVSTPGTPPTLPSNLIPFSGAISIAGAEYRQDQITGLWYKTVWENGVENNYGPSATVPF